MPAAAVRLTGRMTDVTDPAGQRAAPGSAGTGGPGLGLEASLRRDLTAAMRARDQVRTATLRMALAALSTEAAAGAEHRDLSDDEVVRVLGREARKRAEAADAFERAGRGEQAERETAERAVLQEYLPTPLSDAEVADLVARAVAETGASGPRGMGPVMGVVTPRVAGRAEGARVAAEVRRQLQGG